MQTRETNTIKESQEDLSELQLLNDKLAQEVQQLTQTIDTLESAVKKSDEKYQNLLAQFKLSQHRRYCPQSESKKNPQQRDLFDEAGIGVPTAPETDEDEDANAITVPSHKRRSRGKRPKLPADLPREEILLDVTDAEKQCACCQKQRPCIGEDVTEKLKIIPPQFTVLRYVRPKYGNCCETEGLVQAKLPRLFLPKHFATPSLAAHLIVSKYEDHLPLYRQSQIWKRYHIDFSRATMCRIILKTADYCHPLIDAATERIVQSDYVQVDETTVQVLKESGKKNTSQSYMWCYRGGPPNAPSIVFEYQPSRSGKCAQHLLKDFKGHVQCDGYGGYNFVQHDNTKTRGGCMAHLRRKFMDVLKISKTEGLAKEAVLHIAKLYEIEALARAQHFTPEQRHTLRQERARPLMEELKAWLDERVIKVMPRGKLGEAFNYALNQWPYMITYLDNGAYEIDNNAAENLIRPFALGRKNWLFMGSPKGADAGAIHYSLIAQAKANNLIPFEYLRYVFTHIRDCQLTGDYEKLLAHNLSPDDLKI